MADVEKMIVNSTVRIVTCDWNMECRLDLFTNNGFRITEKGKTDTQHQPGKYSIHSPLYGTDYSDESAFEDRYSCTCGKRVGASYKNTKCPFCGDTVEYIDIDLRKTGWIILDKDVIIQPEFYKKIQSIIGTRLLSNMLEYKDESTRNASEKFDGIGYTEFIDRFDEILNYYIRKKPGKIDQYNFIMAHKSMVFANCIPVYSSHLRPFIIRAEEIRYSDEDKMFRRIFSNSVLLNDKYELARRVEVAKKRATPNRKTIDGLRKDALLANIQADLNSLWNLSFETIKKKTGQTLLSA